MLHLMPRNFTALLTAILLAVSMVGVAVVPVAASHDGGDCSFPLTETDATGTDVTLEEPPQEVVVTDAASAQTVWEIGARENVTGMPVRRYTEYLEGSGERTDVLTDDGTDIEVETIIDLEPDLVIAANPQFHSEESIRQLRDAGITVFQYPFEESLEDIYAKTETYGHLLGECEAADATAEETREEVETVRQAVAGAEQPRVLYYFFGFTAGEGTFIGDLIETAGGENVAASAGIEGFAQINDETIAEQDPEWIVTTDDPGSIDTEREPFPSTTAVRNDQVIEVDADLVSQAGPGITRPLLTMVEAFHPEALEEARRSDGSAPRSAGAPEITEYDVTSDGDGITVTFQSNESLVGIEVAVGGPDGTTLDREDFSGDRFRGFGATVEVDEDGRYTAELLTAVDASNNDGARDDTYSESVSVEGTGGNATTPVGSTATPTDETVTAASATATATETAVAPTADPETATVDDSTESAVTTDSSDDATDTGADGPGFGVAAALVALLSFALLGRRRP